MIVLSALLLIGVALETAGIGMMVPLMSALVSQESSFSNEAIQIFDINPELLNQNVFLLYLVSLMFMLFFIKNIFLCWLAFVQAQFAADVRKDLSNKLLSR